MWPVEFGREENRRRFKIAFARFSSAFSRRSRRNSSDSVVVTPSRDPSSTCACRTHFRSVSAVVTPEQRSDPSHRCPLRLILRTFRDHPHRPNLQLRRIPLRGVPWHDSNLPNNRSLRTHRGRFTFTFGTGMGTGMGMGMGGMRFTIDGREYDPDRTDTLCGSAPSRNGPSSTIR